MLVEYVKENYYAMFHDPSYHRYRKRHFSILLDVKFCQMSVECEMYVKGTGSMCVLVEYFKENGYASFHDEAQLPLPLNISWYNHLHHSTTVRSAK